MTDTMKFGYLEAHHNTKIAERAIPEVKEDEVLVRQLACNICTTEYQQWLGLREHQGYPICGGHEGAGIVEKVGKNVKGLSVGDLVAVGYDSCGECEMCQEGRYTECLYPTPRDKKTDDGFLGQFGFATHCVRKGRMLHKMNPELDPAEAGFLEPVATVCKGMKKLRLEPSETVVVIGAGTMGLLNAKVAKAKGARVIVSELLDKKLEAAKNAGFETVNGAVCDPAEEVMKLTGGRGADCVIAAVASTGANKQAVDMLKKNDGRILLFAAGYPAPEIPFDSNLIHYRRIEIIGTYDADAQEFNEAARLLNTRQVEVLDLVEPKRYKLDDLDAAFAAAATPGMFRVCVEMK